MAKADLPGGALFLEESAITYHFIDQAAISHSHDQQITHSSVKGHALQWRFIKAKSHKFIIEKLKKEPLTISQKINALVA